MDINTVVEIDPFVCEYLGNQTESIPDVDPITRSFRISPCGETLSDLKRRCHRHLFKVLKRMNGEVWVITHGIVIYNIVQILKYKMMASTPEKIGRLSVLDAVIYEPAENTVSISRNEP
jgi:broad specificity phosphatase PhoE